MLSFQLRFVSSYLLLLLLKHYYYFGTQIMAMFMLFLVWLIIVC